VDTNNKVIAAVCAVLFTLVLLIVSCAPAYGQAQVRHYQSDIVMQEDGNLLQQHLLVGTDGQMGVVVMTGPPGTQPVAVGLAGPRTYTDVDDDGNAAFCFTVESLEGFDPPEAGNRFIGQESCYVWLGSDDDVMYETGSTPFGEVTSYELRWCGKEHLLQAKPDPNVRGT
jgi:hypothetical protein